MKIGIDLKDQILIADVQDVAPLISAIGCGQLYKLKSWVESSSSDAEFVESDSGKSPKIFFVESAQLEEKPEPLKKIQEEKAAAERNWLAQYTRAAELEKENAELKKKIEGAGLALTD